MSFILTMQYRLTPLSGKRHPRPQLVRNKEFKLALKFLKIRSLVNSDLLEPYNYWKELVRQHDRGPDRRHHHHKDHPEKEEEHSVEQVNDVSED